jgi:hypothetical protein
MKTEIAPTDHAAIFRFTFTGDSSNVIFDNVEQRAPADHRPGDGVVSGWSDVAAASRTAPRACSSTRRSTSP